MACFLTGLLITRLALLVSVPVPVLAEDPVPGIEISAPVVSNWKLSPEGTQPKTIEGVLRVTTTNADGKDWHVSAVDLSEETAGHLTEYINDAYNTGTKLAVPLQIRGPAGAVNLPNGGILVPGNGVVTDQPYEIWFDQTVQWSDTVSSSYRITVTFTAGFAP